MIALIRIRGSVGVRHDIKQTFKMLRLNACNHLVLLPETNTVKGMLKKIENHATFGTINEKTLAKLLEKKAKKNDFSKVSPEVTAHQLIEGTTSLKNLGINPVFRLSPPRKGFERGGIKKPFKLGGALGDRKEKINELIERMT